MVTSWKKKAMIAVLTLCLVGSMTACSKPSTDTKKEVETKTEQPVQQEAEKKETKQEEVPKQEQKDVTIEIWTTPQWKGVYNANEDGADYDSFLKKAAEEFKKVQPHVTVNVNVIPGDQRSDKLNVAMQARTLPDAFFEASFAMTQYVHQGAIAPIDDIISEDARKDIPEAIWEESSIGGKTYFYPFSNNPATLAYNADLFKQAGLDKYIKDEYEIATWTLEEYEEILKTLKEKLPEITPMGLFALNSSGDTWNFAWLRMFDTPFFGKDGKLVANDEATVKALTKLNDWRKAGYTTSGPESMKSSDVRIEFQSQKVGIINLNSIQLGIMHAQMDEGKIGKFDVRLANIPGATRPHTFTYVLSGMVFNTGDEARMQAAKDFVKFFSENQELLQASKTSVPVRESVAKTIEDKDSYLLSYMENAKYLFNFSNNTPGYAELRNLFFPELQAVFSEAKTPQEAMDNFTQQGNKVIERETKNSEALR